MKSAWNSYGDWPTSSFCDQCEEEKDHEGGDHDVADYPDGDELGRMRPVFTCADCLNAPEGRVLDGYEPAGDGQLHD